MGSPPSTSERSSRTALILIVLAELFGTSLWFSGNNAINEYASLWQLSSAGRAWLLMAVQLGFISGTLGLAVSGLADAFRAHHVFAVASLLGAAANAGFVLLSDGIVSAIGFRFATGLALAGIYPLGMKLVVSWAPQQAGMALGWLVGALTLGTATPFLIRGFGGIEWRWAVLAASGLALMGGICIAFLGEGPAGKPRSGFAWGKVWSVFRVPAFRASALGYFGHMWELYAFWAMVPVLVAWVCGSTSTETIAVGTFLVIGLGGLGCVAGGWYSRRVGSKKPAVVALSVSGGMCLLFPLAVSIPMWAGFVLLGLWGFAVVADSPQFSAMSAKAAPADAVGSALAVQNAIGFFITVFSIQLTEVLLPIWGKWTPWVLLPGPIFGLWCLATVGIRAGNRTSASDNPSRH